MPRSPRASAISLTMLMVGLALPTLITWLYFVAMADQPASWQQGSYTLGKLVQFALPLVWWIWFRPQRAASPPEYGRSVLVGLGFGAAVVVAGWGVHRFLLAPLDFYAASLPEIQAKVRGMNLASPGAFIGLGVFYSLVHSLLEEYYWRWFVFREARQWLTFPWAATISSLGFMTHHVLVLATYFGWDSPSTYLFSAAVAIGGAVWAWLYERYGTLLGPWLSHLLIDALIFAIGYHLVFA